jgi:hypothetical protein
MLDNTAAQYEACPYKPMVNPGQNYFRDINKKGYILNITDTIWQIIPDLYIKYHYMTKFGYKKLSLQQKQLGATFFLYTKFRKINRKILATFLGMSAKL